MGIARHLPSSSLLDRFQAVGLNPGVHRFYVMCGFHPRDLVECIDNTPVHPESTTMPELGIVHTVESVRPLDDGYSVRLVELVPACHSGPQCQCGECGWDARRFRKLPRREGDRLAVLRALLDLNVTREREAAD